MMTTDPLREADQFVPGQVVVGLDTIEIVGWTVHEASAVALHEYAIGWAIRRLALSQPTLPLDVERLVAAIHNWHNPSAREFGSVCSSDGGCRLDAAAIAHEYVALAAQPTPPLDAEHVHVGQWCRPCVEHGVAVMLDGQAEAEAVLAELRETKP